LRGSSKTSPPAGPAADEAPHAVSTPRFSILVPTRDRPATLRHTLATVASQEGDDYEIVVADNCSAPETRAIVQALGARNVRYLRSDEALPMAENWERGLAECSGEYITVLGDDDALVPHALAMARALLDETQAEIVSWSPHVYWWPDTIVPWLRNLLITNLGRGSTRIASRGVLQDFYAGRIAFGIVPQIYSGFFHRGIIEEARLRYDAFCTPRDVAPDVASGILGLHITESYVFSMHPFSIRGNSGKSTGTAQWMRHVGAEQREAYFRDERLRVDQMMHPTLIASPHLDIVIANTQIKCKEAYFPGDAELEVDLHRVLRDMISGLNREPEAYDDNVADVRAFAAKLGVKLAAGDIPARQPKERQLIWGPDVSQDGIIAKLGVNCELAQVFNVADAARLIEAILPAEYGNAAAR
jgi:glycosyltransferase involved in cell wall biosynthesis